ncbi:MAG: histidinol-phosphate transaminase [Parabacteroides sp.]|nr:histidinol-phosphate transaminase [Parabacteroides sp.]MDY4757422.1 histidinol-phosphate transaminase [Parabacteroides sp.]
MRSLEELVRPNVWRMRPYSSARNEFQGNASVFLDANENPWNEPINRYPDPLQRQVKARISQLKGVDSASIFLGNGSDEAIDLVIRAFCEPKEDNIVTIAPSYGMYEVAAETNDVECRKVVLDDHFDLDIPALWAAVDAHTKVIFLCSPNNPSGNSLNREAIYQLLRDFEGLVVVDEAYIDFSAQPSFLSELTQHPNLIVLQTFSKAWGAAAIRLGMAFAAPAIIDVLNKIKYPYNINLLVQNKALELMENEAEMRQEVKAILEERARMTKRLSEAPFGFEVFPSDANFLLVRVGDADQLYKALVDRGIIVRNRNRVQKCEGCLRITIGLPAENDLLLDALSEEVQP